MPLEFHRYTLWAKAAPNAATSRREFPGALIRTEEGGHGCIHPWPELGDATLEEELAALAAGRALPLALRALSCAMIDGRGRAEGRSLFAGLEIPASHYLWRGELDLDSQAELVKSGDFPALKLKLGPDLAESLGLVRMVAEAMGGLPFRLDFNATLTAEEADRFFEELGRELRLRIEFVEDPCPFDSATWSQLGADWGVSLALDHGFRPDTWNTGVALGILKPTRDDASLPSQVPVVVTSAMDHPIGQHWAAWWATGIAHRTPERFHGAGLLTHEHFEGEPCLDLVRSEGARLLSPGGTGLGFDEYLADLDWEELR